MVAEVSSDNTGAIQNPNLFQPGKSGNPAGRPKGSRNKLGEAFVEALHEDFNEHGVAAIETVRTEKPDQYLKVIAQVIPKEFHHTVEDYDGYSDDDLAAEFTAIAARLNGRSQNGVRARAPSQDEGGAGEVPN